MLQEALDTLDFFLPQLVIGSLLGAIISIIGVIIVLRRMAFFGVTLSQVASFATALALFFNIKTFGDPSMHKNNVPHSEFLHFIADVQGDLLLIILVCAIVMIPLLILQKNHLAEQDTIMGIIFVSFTAFSQILLTLGGNVKNHFMAAYFGDILTSQISFLSIPVILIGISILLFILFYRRILFLSFDEDEFRTRKLSYFGIEILFYFILIVLISISVNMLGAFFSIAHLLIPVYIALFFARSMWFLFVFSFLFSLFSTIIGFGLSVIPYKYAGNEINLPTSSIIVVCMTVFAVSIVLFRKSFRYVRKNWFWM